MAISDHDLENLESWLDGELSEQETEQLRGRLSADPALAQTAERLRSDRQMRSQIWQTMEPAERDVDRLVAGVRRGVQRDEIWTMRFRALRGVSAVAASIALVFMVGWISRDRLRVQHPGDGVTVAGVTPTPVGRIVLPTQPPNAAGSLHFFGNSAQQNPSGTNLVLFPINGQQILVPSSAFRVGPRDKFVLTLETPAGERFIRQVDDLQDLHLPDEFMHAMMNAGQPQAAPSQIVPVSAPAPMGR